MTRQRPEIKPRGLQLWPGGKSTGALFPWLPVGSSEGVVRGDFELVSGATSDLEISDFRCTIVNPIIIPAILALGSVHFLQAGLFNVTMTGTQRSTVLRLPVYIYPRLSAFPLFTRHSLLSRRPPHWEALNYSISDSREIRRFSFSSEFFMAKLSRLINEPTY